MIRLITTCLGLSVVLMLAGIVAAWGDDVRPTFSRHEVVGAFGAFGIFVFGVLRQLAVRVARIEGPSSTKS